MNIADLQAAVNLSPLTIMCCVAALCGVVLLVINMVNDDDPLLAVAGWLCICIFGIAAYDNALDDYYGSRETVFASTLKEDFNLESTVGLREIVTTAENGGTVAMTEAGKLIDVRPVIEHDVLRLYRATDGKLITSHP